LYWKLELRAMTNSSPNRESSVMMSSTTPVGQVLLLGIGAQIGEGEDGNGGLVREGKVGRRRIRTDVLSEDRSSFLLLHCGYEADALPRHGLDEPLRLASVADRTARRVDAGRHGRVGNDSSTPDCSKQIIPADHTLAVSNQVFEEIEGLGLKTHGVTAVAQFATVRVKSIIIKEITHSRFQEAVTVHGSTLLGNKKQAGGKEKQALLKVQPQPCGYALTLHGRRRQASAASDEHLR
jgi:hypothetical protein